MPWLTSKKQLAAYTSILYTHHLLLETHALPFSQPHYSKYCNVNSEFIRKLKSNTTDLNLGSKEKHIYIYIFIYNTSPIYVQEAMTSTGLEHKPYSYTVTRNIPKRTSCQKFRLNRSHIQSHVEFTFVFCIYTQLKQSPWCSFAHFRPRNPSSRHRRSQACSRPSSS